MALIVHTSNRTELLVSALVDHGLRPPLNDPFIPEWIVVNSWGMESWLRQSVTAQLEFTANLRFPFCTSFFRTLLDLHPDLAERWTDSAPFSKPVLLWRIYRLLGHPDRWGVEPLTYLTTGHEHEIKRLELAQRLAILFDEYQVYRPDILSSWVQDETADDWQARLWRELKKETSATPWGETLQRLCRDIEKLSLSKMTRAAVFGVSHLPPLFIDVIAGLATRIDVRVFLLEASPCSRNDQSSLEESWGSTGRDFRDLLRDRGAEFIRHMVSPTGTSMLNTAQRYVFEGREHSSASQTVRSTDTSIRFHACHAPHRQVEVLHDILLDCFVEDPGLSPRDILVMAPDIGVFAPHIDAVFGASSGVSQTPPIPYTISDRADMAHSSPFQAFMALLDLPGQRFKVSEILDLLAMPTILDAADLDERDAHTIRTWIDAVRIHWGYDDAHRSQLSLPQTTEGTWRAGLDRLLAGYAIGPDHSSPSAGIVAGISPWPHVEGENALLVGKLCQLLDRLRSIAVELSTKRTLSEWSSWFTSAILYGLFARGDTDIPPGFHVIESLLEDMVSRANEADLDEPVSIDVVRKYLSEQAHDSSRGGGFYRGMVTFCSMVPMRSIPARIVFLLGMDDGAFPRTDERCEISLVNKSDRTGDRSRRRDDRYLFLEALLAARDKIHIFFSGRRRDDNEKIPPSILVTELIEYLDDLTDPSDRQRSRFDESLLPWGWIEHRLQPFNPEYFDSTIRDLFSYSATNGIGARNRSTPAQNHEFFPLSPSLHPLPPLKDFEGHLTRLTPNSLARFWLSPPAFLLQERLGVFLHENRQTAIHDDELLVAEDRLLAWRISDHVVASQMASETQSTCWSWLLGMGWMNDTPRHRHAFSQHWLQAKAFLSNSLSQQLLSQTSDLLEVSITIGSGTTSFLMTGCVTPIIQQTVVNVRYGKLTNKDRLLSLIQHLCLCAQGDPVTSCLARLHPQEGRTRPSGAPIIYRLHPISESVALERLSWLVSMYHEGLMRPLPFDLEIAMNTSCGTKKPTTRPLRAFGPLYCCMGPQGVETHAEFATLAREVVSLLDGLEEVKNP